MDDKIWLPKPYDLSLANNLKAELGCSLLLAKLLVIRKIEDKSLATQFLNPSLNNLTEPLNFADMHKAQSRLAQAIFSNEIIGIFGDYDVDGVCATALMADFFHSIGANFCTTLPNRLTEGYGLSKAGVDRLKALGASVLVTVDCGILAHEQISYAKSLGFDVIVVDHHNVGEKLPEALAIINPKRQDCLSGADYLCAAGVAFFLCMALRRFLREQDFFKTRPEPDLRDLLDLVALASVCDVVPLIKHNRSLVKAGLKMIKQARRVGLSALSQQCGVNSAKISATNIGFHLGPRINAAGRLEDAQAALSLMLSTDMSQAATLAQLLDNTNSERKELEQSTVEEAINIINAWDILPNAIVLHNEAWHPGVVGIVASRIAERFHRPSIIIGQKGKGSGRSIKGLDLHALVQKASQSLSGFGGHAHAIGLSLGTEGVEKFRNDLIIAALENTDSSLFKKKIYYDQEINLGDVNLELCSELSTLEPFGAANPQPILRINNCYFRNLRKLEGGHLKGEVENQSGQAPFIAFRTSIDDELAKFPLDLLVAAEKNEWQGRQSAQLRVIEFQRSM